MSDERPRFLPSFIELIKRETEVSGVLALVPYKLVLCGLLGGGAAYIVPAEFWTNARWDVSTAVFTGLMTFGGLVLALGWNAFSRIYELLFRGDFGAYLQEKKKLNDYLVHISFMHFVQILAVVFSGVGLVSVLFNQLPLLADRTVLGLSFTFTLYGLKQALDSVTAMNDLAWHSATFERHKAATSNNVVRAFGSKNG